MNLNCHKIKILDQDEKNWRVKFLESNVVMMIANSIVQSKIKDGFYKVV
ncbi:MAG: hypothetical protein AB8H03_00330 [Saprospiraceae bacterium]